MAIGNQLALCPSGSIEGTAGSATGATAVALPNSAASSQFMVTNLDASSVIYFKTGLSTGQDASTNTLATRVPIPPGSVQVFTRRSTDTHIYLYAAANANYSVVSGEGY